MTGMMTTQHMAARRNVGLLTAVQARACYMALFPAVVFVLVPLLGAARRATARIAEKPQA